MIRVYFADAEALNDEKLYTDYLNRISPFRKAKTERFKFRKDRNLSLGAGVLLDIGLEKYGMHEKEMQYLENENGKPFFANAQDIYFSISHSKDKLMVCFSDSEIGCDIEKISKANLDVAERFFNLNEYTELIREENENERDELFCRLWTLKESFMKTVGGGLSIPMNSFEILYENDNVAVKQSLNGRNYYFEEFNSFPEYKSAVCSMVRETAVSEFIQF